MKFRTILEPKPPPLPLSHGENIVLAGSCFTNHIGKKLARYRFSVSINPFGTIFNPISLCQNLQYCLQNKLPAEAGYLCSQQVWYHYQIHSTFAALNRNDLRRKIAQKWEKTRPFLRQCKHLILTLGTAWIYRLRTTGEIVANCHKMPSSAFKKELLRAEDIEKAISTLKNILAPHTQIILTVSPVRHLKETLEGNSVSKSVLRLACHKLTQQDPNIYYFPAYEILLDDLRDYRFFAPDLLHPSQQAIDYIWEKFYRCATRPQTQSFITDFEQLLQQIEHRPNVPQSQAHRQFLEKLRTKLKHIKTVSVEDLSAQVAEKLTKFGLSEIKRYE